MNNPASIMNWATTAPKSGIWGPGGIAHDGTNLFVTTGNATVGSAFGQQESIVRLQPGPVFSGSTTDFWAPTNWMALDNAIRSRRFRPASRRCPRRHPVPLVVALGKDGRAYVLNRNALTGVSVPLASAIVGSNNIQADATYRTATGTYVVFRPTTGTITAFRITATNPPTIATGWTVSSAGRSSPFVTSTDGTNNMIVWAFGTGTANTQVLRGYNGDTGAVVYNGGGTNELMAGTRSLQYRHRGSRTHLHRRRQQSLCVWPDGWRDTNPNSYRNTNSYGNGDTNSYAALCPVRHHDQWSARGPAQRLAGDGHRHHRRQHRHQPVVLQHHLLGPGLGRDHGPHPRLRSAGHECRHHPHPAKWQSEDRRFQLLASPGSQHPQWSQLCEHPLGQLPQRRDPGPDRGADAPVPKSNPDRDSHGHRYSDSTATATATIAPTPSPTLSPGITPSPTPTATATVAPTATPAQAVNLSTRMFVQTGDNAGIGGFIISGSAPKHVLVRVIGPSLTQFGVPNPLADPTLELHGPTGFTTVNNDNWQDDPVQAAPFWPPAWPQPIISNQPLMRP